MSLFQEHFEKCLKSSRTAALIERLERGETVTQAEVNQTVTLQALDTVRAGELFVLEQSQLEAQADERVFGKWLRD